MYHVGPLCGSLDISPFALGTRYYEGLVLDDEALQKQLTEAAERFADRVVQLFEKARALDHPRPSPAHAAPKTSRVQQRARPWYWEQPANTNASVFLDRMAWIATPEAVRRYGLAFSMAMTTAGLVLDRGRAWPPQQ